MSALSVVVPTYRRPGALQRLLRSLPAAGLVAEDDLVVVDDAHDDATAAIVAAVAGARYVLGPGRGPAAARNRGWRAAREAQVLFVDDDCVAEPGVLDRLRRVVRDDAAVGLRIEPMPGSDLIERFMHYECLSSHKVVNGDVKYLVAAAVAYPRSALETLGGFDEGLTASGEDAELCWRFRRVLHGQLTILDDSVVRHEYRGDLRTLARIYRRHGSAQRYLLEHVPERKDDVSRGFRDRISPRAWMQAFRRYRRDEPPLSATVCLALRLCMMVPFVVGTIQGQFSGKKW